MNAEVDPIEPEPDREPTPAAWAECAAALRAVGLDPETGGRLSASSGDRGPTAPRGAETEFLARVLAIEARRSRVIGRPSRRRRFELRETLAAAGYRVETRSRWGRGLRLAGAYGCLRLRESRALRIAGVLLLMHIFAMPVMAWVSQRQLAEDSTNHGTVVATTDPIVLELAVEPIVELEAEEPIEDLDRPRQR